MRGKQYLTRSVDYDRVYRQKASWASKLLVLRVASQETGTDSCISRYGFSISKHVGGAVVRNRIRRRLREIIRELPLKPGWDIVFIVRQPAAEARFGKLREDVEKLLARAGLLSEKDEVYCLKTD